MVNKVSLVDMMIANNTALTLTKNVMVEKDTIDTTMEEGEAGQLLHHHTIENKVVEQCIMV